MEERNYEYRFSFALHLGPEHSTPFWLIFSVLMLLFQLLISKILNKKKAIASIQILNTIWSLNTSVYLFLLTFFKFSQAAEMMCRYRYLFWLAHFRRFLYFCRLSSVHFLSHFETGTSCLFCSLYPAPNSVPHFCSWVVFVIRKTSWLWCVRVLGSHANAIFFEMRVFFCFHYFCLELICANGECIEIQVTFLFEMQKINNILSINLSV